MMNFAYTYVLTLLSLGALAVAGRGPRFEPLPECSECVPIVAPGIGIDLIASYGTAAIRYHDGSFVDLGRVFTDLPKKMRQKAEKYAPRLTRFKAHRPHLSLVKIFLQSFLVRLTSVPALRETHRCRENLLVL